jgi:hypothetical protein
MQCNKCAAQLPGEAAYCPSCGSVTPYHISFSGVTPSDTTVASSSAPSLRPPPPPFDPYSAPPPPPPHRRRRFSGSRMVLLVALVLLIGGAGGVLSFQRIPPFVQPHPHASPTRQARQVTTVSSTGTPQAQQATASPSARTPQDLYHQVTQNPATLADPLSANGTNNWAENASADGKLRCQFTGGAYHAIAQPQNTYTLCVAQATHFGDLAYQVQMTIAKGDFGGMVFRCDDSQTKYYSFFIDRSGTYTLITSVDDTGTHDYVLHKGTSSFIKTGLNQVNLLAVIARGSTIYLYINQRYITSASDSTYRAGHIGLFGGNTTTAPADVLFRHIQVWNL